MKILFATTRFPYPPTKGDKAIPYYRIKYLSRRHEITLLSFVESQRELDFLPKLAPYCVKIETVVLPLWRSYWNMASKSYRELPLQVLYYRSQAFRRKLLELVAQTKFDLLHTVLLRGAPYTMDLPDVPKVLDMIDALSLNMNRRTKAENAMRRWLFRIEGRRVREFEQEVCAKFDRVIVVSNIDREHLGSPNVMVIPLGVEVPESLSQPKADYPTAIFTGNLGYFPNRDAAMYLVREIFPLLRRAIPRLRLKIVGPNPPNELRRLAKNDSHLEVTGVVEDLWSHLKQAQVALCPLRAGSGMQFKVLEAMACGVPVVASSLAVGDIAARNGEHLLVADPPEDMVLSVKRILENSNLAAELSINGKRLVTERYTWEVTTWQLEQLYIGLLERKANSVNHAHWH